MPDPTSLPQPFDRNPQAAALAGAPSFGLSIDEDVALGFECADPSLQIERWGQEALQSGQQSA